MTAQETDIAPASLPNLSYASHGIEMSGDAEWGRVRFGVHADGGYQPTYTLTVRVRALYGRRPTSGDTGLRAAEIVSSAVRMATLRDEPLTQAWERAALARLKQDHSIDVEPVR